MTVGDGCLGDVPGFSSSRIGQ